jgi:ATP-dependent protease ClpP protease subunit
MEHQTAEARRLQELMVTALVKETKMTRKQVEETVMKPMLDYFLTPEQAIKFGIVDKVMGGS